MGSIRGLGPTKLMSPFEYIKKLGQFVYACFPKERPYSGNTRIVFLLEQNALIRQLIYFDLKVHGAKLQTQELTALPAPSSLLEKNRARRR